MAFGLQHMQPQQLGFAFVWLIHNGDVIFLLSAKLQTVIIVLFASFAFITPRNRIGMIRTRN
jgi:hypothetical protein